MQIDKYVTHIPSAMSVFSDYQLAPQSVIKVEKLVEKWNKEKDNCVFPWDWMFDSTEVESELENTVVVMKEMVIAETQETKRKIEESFTEIDDQPSYKKLCGFSEDKMNQIDSLKKNLHEPESLTSIHLLFQFLKEMSIAQIEMLCEEISLANLPQKSLIDLTKHFIASEENFGINVMTILFKTMFLQTVQSLTQTPPQIFTDTITSLSKKYPRASCDGLLINVIKSCDDLKDQQLDLLNCVIQQCYSEDISLILFQEFLKVGPAWNENWVKFVHTLINLKVSLGDDVLSNLFAAIDKESDSMKKSLNFARLLQSFMNNYGAKLSKNDLLNLQKVVMGNESILKKRLGNYVNKFIS